MNIKRLIIAQGAECEHAFRAALLGRRPRDRVRLQSPDEDSQPGGVVIPGIAASAA